VLQPLDCDNGVRVYVSPLLRNAGVPHGFSTRIGGVSEGPFRSLNLGNPSGQAQQDAAEHLTENYRRLHQAIGCEDRTRVFAHQVHGACVLDPAISPATDSMHGGTEIGRGDAIVSGDATKLLSIRVADCVPVLLADQSGRRVAAIHAGWRGVVLGAAIETLRHFYNPAHVLAAIGPSISLEQFEVSGDVLVEFQHRFGADTPYRQSPKGASKAHIDLREALRIQLNRAGVPVSQIDMTDRCTVTHGDEFFSHRRDNGLTGRMAAVIGAVR